MRSRASSSTLVTELGAIVVDAAEGRGRDVSLCAAALSRCQVLPLPGPPPSEPGLGSDRSRMTALRRSRRALLWRPVDGEEVVSAGPAGGGGVGLDVLVDGHRARSGFRLGGRTQSAPAIAPPPGSAPAASSTASAHQLVDGDPPRAGPLSETPVEGRRRRLCRPGRPRSPSLPAPASPGPATGPASLFPSPSPQALPFGPVPGIWPGDDTRMQF